VFDVQGAPPAGAPLGAAVCRVARRPRFADRDDRRHPGDVAVLPARSRLRRATRCEIPADACEGRPVRPLTCAERAQASGLEASRGVRAPRQGMQAHAELGCLRPECNRGQGDGRFRPPCRLGRGFPAVPGGGRGGSRAPDVHAPPPRQTRPDGGEPDRARVQRRRDQDLRRAPSRSDVGRSATGAGSSRIEARTRPGRSNRACSGSRGSPSPHTSPPRSGEELVALR
jgi:hypothetical protein